MKLPQIYQSRNTLLEIVNVTSSLAYKADWFMGIMILQWAPLFVITVKGIIQLMVSNLVIIGQSLLINMAIPFIEKEYLPVFTVLLRPKVITLSGVYCSFIVWQSYHIKWLPLLVVRVLYLNRNFWELESTFVCVFSLLAY